MEPPGTAPGSDPLITGAFIAIVPKDMWNVGVDWPNFKRNRYPSMGCCDFIAGFRATATEMMLFIGASK